MPEIKTREIAKGTVKAIDKSAVAAERIKSAYIRTKDKKRNSGIYCVAFLLLYILILLMFVSMISNPSLLASNIALNFCLRSTERGLFMLKKSV